MTCSIFTIDFRCDEIMLKFTENSSKVKMAARKKVIVVQSCLLIAQAYPHRNAYFLHLLQKTLSSSAASSIRLFILAFLFFRLSFYPFYLEFLYVSYLLLSLVFFFSLILFLRIYCFTLFKRISFFPIVFHFIF